MRQQIFTLANQFTLLRLALIPFFALAVLDRRYGLALVVFIVAGVSDTLDGTLARRLNQRTAVGAYLDPLADKLLLSTAFVVLALEKNVPWALTILVLARDIIILAIAAVIIIATGSHPVRPSVYGKACTVTQIATVLAVLLVAVVRQGWLVWTQGLLLWLTAALTVVSGLHYAYQVGRILPQLPSES